MSKEKRIQRILNEPLTGLLARARTKQVLAAIAVVSSWVYLFTLNPGNEHRPLDGAATYQLHLIAGFLMVTSFILLRRSVRHITSVPDEYLDERQIANRNWAFSMGYLVVRRVGLALSVIFVGFIFCYNVWNQFYYSTVPAASPIDPRASMFYNGALHFVYSFFGDDLLASTGDIVLLLTYVAYSFPIILLAWREAKSFDAEEVAEIENRQWATLLLRIARGYNLRIIWVGVGVLLMLASPLLALKNASFETYLIFGTLLYALYVYAWGMLQQWQAIRLLGGPGVPAQYQSTKDSLFKMFVALSLLGISVLVLMLLGIWNIGLAIMGAYALAAGIAMVPMHLSSFALIKSVAKRELKLTSNDGGKTSV